MAKCAETSKKPNKRRTENRVIFKEYTQLFILDDVRMGPS